MARGFGFKINSGGVAKKAVAAFLGHSNTIAKAATGAMREMEVGWKADGRANIAAAGFSEKWQNALRTATFPKKPRDSINAATKMWHNIPYSGVFERGAQIGGHPLLWLPLPNIVGMKLDHGRRPTPAGLISRGVKLSSVNHPGHPPLLVARVPRNSDPRARTRRLGPNRDAGGLSLGKLRAKSATDSGGYTTVPIFFGIPMVTIRKRFDIAGTTSKARAKLPGLYAKHVIQELG